MEYSLNQAELAHRTHAERLVTVESQVRDEAKGRRSELQRHQEANQQTKEWVKLVETTNGSYGEHEGTRRSRE